MPRGIFVRTQEYLVSLSRAKIGNQNGSGNKGREGNHNAVMPTLTLEQIARRNQSNTKYEQGYQIHLSRFRNMQWRVKIESLVCDFPYNPEGFIAFIDYIGPIPTTMIKPSVGRYNHKLGYIVDNFRWQELSENLYEAAQRKRSYEN